MPNIIGITRRIQEEGLGFAVLVPRKVFETEAWAYLSFAREDHQEGGERGLVNALSNAKRAVQNRVDTLLYAYCLRPHAERERWNYPKKADYLRRAGVPVRDVLRRQIVSWRNELEHDYVVPTNPAEVGDSIDVAELFLEATDSRVKSGFFRWCIGPRDMPKGFDPAGATVENIPPQTYGLIFDHPKRELTLREDGKIQSVAFAAISLEEITQLCRVLNTSLQSGTVNILGPIDESVFEFFYL